MSEYYLGIDLGGTEVKIAIVNSFGRIIEETSIENSGSFKPKDLAKEIARKTKEFKNYKSILRAGVGVAGDINQEKGVVRFSPNLKYWKNIPLKRLLRQYFRVPILIKDNDANVAALGAYYLDAKKKIKNLICVYGSGTGVGGG